MQPGSLVQCIKKVAGFILVEGKYIDTNGKANVGDIFTIQRICDVYAELFNGTKVKRGTGLIFEEIPVFIHPTLGVECSMPASHFVEIQPPMMIPESLFNTDQVKA
jgi:hypothetical protein